MQFKNILLSVIASAALINAAALPVATDHTKIDPTTDPCYQTCVTRVSAHRQGTHLPTQADKDGYADICSNCFGTAYRACEMATTSDHDVLADYSTGCFPDYVKHCVGLNAGGPQVANPDTPVNVPVTVDKSAKRDIDQGDEPTVPGASEPNMNVPASLVSSGKRDIDQGGEPKIGVPGASEPNMNVPASLVNAGN